MRRFLIVLATLGAAFATASAQQQPKLADGLSLVGIGQLQIKQGEVSIVAQRDSCRDAFTSAGNSLLRAYWNASPVEKDRIYSLQKQIDRALATDALVRDGGAYSEGAAAAMQALCDPETLRRLTALVASYRTRGLILTQDQQRARDAGRQATDLRDAIDSATEHSQRVLRACSGVSATLPPCASQVPQGTSARQ